MNQKTFFGIIFLAFLITFTSLEVQGKSGEEGKEDTLGAQETNIPVAKTLPEKKVDKIPTSSPIAPKPQSEQPSYPASPVAVAPNPVINYPSPAPVAQPAPQPEITPEPEPKAPAISAPATAKSGYGNEPAGYSRLTLQTFGANIPVGSGLPISDGWQILWNPAGNGKSVEDSSAPSGDGEVFKILYPKGFTGGSAPATAYYNVGGKKNLYMSTWWKANADFQGHESNVNKLQFIFLSENSDIYLTTYGTPGGPYELRVCLQFKTTGGDERCWLMPNVSSGKVDFGAWHKIEWLIEIPEDNTKGVIKWWLDGKLVGSYSDVKFPPGATITEYKISPTWGGVNDTKRQDDYFWFDEAYLSTK